MSSIKVKDALMAALDEKESLAVVAGVHSGSADQKEAKRKVWKEMGQTQQKKLKKEEERDGHQQQSKQKNIEALSDPSTDEKTKKACMKALRVKAVEEAMREKTNNSGKSEPPAEEEEDFDPSSLVEAEMDENYEDTLVEVNIPGKNPLDALIKWGGEPV